MVCELHQIDVRFVYVASVNIINIPTQDTCTDRETSIPQGIDARMFDDLHSQSK